jgi:hypothetical protein
MIVLKNGYSRQKIYANKVSFWDVFIPTTYQHYEGNRIPISYEKQIRHTNVVDLTQNIESILANMKSNTRNEVRRAEREGCFCVFTENIRDFIPFYNSFAKEKGLDDNLTSQRLSKYGRVIIGIAKHDEIVLSMHATAFDIERKKAMLLYSCSPRLEDGIDKKMIGWGNRLLHFKEFEYFKQMGMAEYDWNGICLDPEQIERYNIGLFKQAFGGVNKDNVCLLSPSYRLLKYIESMLGNKDKK